MFKEDIENIKGIVYNNLKPLIRKSEKKHFRVQISKSFFLHLQNNLNLNGRFKDATHFIEAYGIPTVYEIENDRASGMVMFQSRISNGKQNGRFSTKP